MLDITKIGTDGVQGDDADSGVKKIDDTVTVVATIKNSAGDKYQAIKYSSNGYVQMSSAKVQTGYGLQLTLSSAAKITIEALTKKGQSDGTWSLIDPEAGSEKAASDKQAGIITGDSPSSSDTPTSLVFADVPAGKYLLGAKAGGGYLYSLKIEYK